MRGRVNDGARVGLRKCTIMYLPSYAEHHTAWRRRKLAMAVVDLGQLVHHAPAGVCVYIIDKIVNGHFSEAHACSCGVCALDFARHTNCACQP